MRDGRAFRQGLRDGREVWLGGERVKDVTEHPALRPAIDAVAELYDLQFDNQHREVLTFEGKAIGGRAARAFQLPRTPADLKSRRESTRILMEQSCGFLGRGPDFMNMMITAMAAKSAHFGKQSVERQSAMEENYRRIASKDLFLTHALNDPQTDRSKRRHEQPDPGICLHVVQEDRKGIYVSGSKILATAAAYADEVLIWPFPPTFGPGDEPYAICALIPIASPGLKIFCRPPFTRVGDLEDFPLSSRFDEMDSVLVFDKVFVPWDRVFLYKDLNLINRVYYDTRIRDLTAHQTAVRMQVKLEFIYALLLRMAQSIGTDSMPPVMQSLGEAAAYIEIIRSTVLASEYQAKVDPENGVLYPEFSSLIISRLMAPRFYPEMMQKIRRFGASGLLQVPSSFDDFDGAMGPDLERYYRGANVDAREKVRLVRLAWDIVGTEFGSRHALYELFYAGDPDMAFIGLQREYPRKNEHMATFDRLFAKMASPSEAAEPDTRKASVGAGA